MVISLLLARPLLEDLSGRPTHIPDALTVEEVAQLLRISARTVRRRISRYELGDSTAWPTHVIRIGRIIRVPASELRTVLGIDPAA